MWGNMGLVRGLNFEIDLGGAAGADAVQVTSVGVRFREENVGGISRIV